MYVHKYKYSYLSFRSIYRFWLFARQHTHTPNPHVCYKFQQIELSIFQFHYINIPLNKYINIGWWFKWGKKRRTWKLIKWCYKRWKPVIDVTRQWKRLHQNKIVQFQIEMKALQMVPVASVFLIFLHCIVFHLKAAPFVQPSTNFLLLSPLFLINLTVGCWITLRFKTFSFISCVFHWCFYFHLKYWNVHPNESIIYNERKTRAGNFV